MQTCREARRSFAATSQSLRMRTIKAVLLHCMVLREQSACLVETYIDERRRERNVRRRVRRLAPFMCILCVFHRREQICGCPAKKLKPSCCEAGDVLQGSCGPAAAHVVTTLLASDQDPL